MHKGECDLILDEVSQALSHLDQLHTKYVKVSTKTNTLHEACEHLLAEQVQSSAHLNKYNTIALD